MSNIKVRLPFRQVHLDYHTSELMENVAANFNKGEFVNTLKKAHVNSVTCFARCHHGFLYYPSKAFPERIHPSLTNKNLLLEQVEACQEENIRVPVYVTVQWDHYTAMRHPEWLCRDAEGQLLDQLFSPGFYRYLCTNTSYRDFLKAHVKELCEMIPTLDGFFFDIIWLLPCACPSCRAKMEKEGLDWRKPEDRIAFAKLSIQDFTRDMSNFVHQLIPDCSIYYNSGHIQPDHKSHLKDFTHLEFDALPSGHGSYNNFPIITRTNRTYGYDYAGHTGKFHTGWGDMHSYKNQAALEYECFMLMALGGKCIIGDQLHPLGHLDETAYDIISAVYCQVEEKEPWCDDIQPVIELAVFYTDEEKALTGAHKLLKESCYQYDIISSDSDFTRYKVIILPDRIPITNDLVNKLKDYMHKGGKVLATFLSGADEKANDFMLPLGATMNEDQELDVEGKPVRGLLHFRKDYADYIIPQGPLGKDLPETEHVMYAQANKVSVGDKGNILLHVTEPPFYRNAAHFCSHVQTPSYGNIGTPAAIETSNTLYLAHNVFEIYDEYGASWCKKYVQNAIDYLLGDRILTHTGPSTLEAIVNDQPNAKRYIIHLLHYVPIKRAKLLEIIEDIYPLYDIEISLKLDHPIKEIRLQPENLSVAFELSDKRLHFHVDRFEGHQLIELKY
ncbi:beta-galactosidase trimerization domain-containing protein [Vallitalea okinawensis]|uniref:beta-galactosidase trimerization domain-containing protein n=1 Tax=Vallitalea okinawensis TaxID=2078660 RepID=UPI00147854B9|nr:beta-galactosidase trimerization domain-containing protein [Vallitalea okinawensis]